MPTNVIMPQMGESVAEGTVTKWLKRVGERVERDEPLLEISTDKVDAEIPSPAAGVLSKILVKENETVAVNTVVAVLDGEGEPAEAPGGSTAVAAEPVPSVPAPASPAPSGPRLAAPMATVSVAPAAGRAEKVRSSPLVRRLARERNIDLTRVRGTGQGGRVSKKDVLAYLAGQAGPAAPSVAPQAPIVGAAPPSPAAPAPATPVVFTGPTQVVPMTPMR